MSYNKDELEAPEWVNNEFLEKVLNNEESADKMKVIAFETSPGTNAGDHIASIMFRIKVYYQLIDEKKEISIMLKTMPQVEGFKKDFVQQMGIFEVEQLMYTEILPQVKASLIKANVENPLNSARVLYHSLSPQKILVFEDLKNLKYEMLPRKFPQLSELQLIATKLAHLHAASVKLVSDGNTHIKNLKGGIFNMPNVRDMDVVVNSLSTLQEIVAEIPEFEIYSKKLQNMSVDAILDRCTEIFQKSGKYNVLNHGDFHVKNMMFQLNNENIASDVIFIDYQLCTWGTQAIDLTYLYIFNPLESRNGIIELYHKVYSNVLRKMNYTGFIPTLSELKSELRNCRHFELFLFSAVASFLCIDDTEGVDIEELMKSKEYRLSSYKSSNYRKLMNKMLPIFLEEGTFDM